MLRPSHIACVLLYCMVCTEASAQKRFKIAVDSVPSGASIYLEDKAAGVQGLTPHTFSMKPGTYTFILEALDHHPLTRTVKVKGKANFTFTLEPTPLTARVSLQYTPAPQLKDPPVRINGKLAGKLPLVLDLQPGRYFIEVLHDGYNTWSEWVDIQPREQRKIQVTLVQSLASQGTLLVSSVTPQAEIFVNGSKKDGTPVLLQQLAPGKYIVEVQAKGYLPRREEVVVEAGQTRKISLDLQPDAQTLALTSGTMQILSEPDGAEILVDGKSQGNAPVKVEGLAPGSHLVEARLEGMKTTEQPVVLQKGDFQTIKLTLHQLPPQVRHGSLRVICSVLGAMVFIDGTLAGKTPLLRHNLVPGPHIVTIRKQGFEEQVRSVEVQTAKIVEFKATLEPLEGSEVPTSQASENRPVKTTPEPEPGEDKLKYRSREEILKGLSSFGAQLVPPTFFTTDISFGYVHIFEGRITTGVFSRGNIGLDGGVEIRTFGAMTEVGLHAKFRVLDASPLSMALLFAFGGGGGVSYRNTVHADLGLVWSVWIKKLVTLSARAYFNFYSDRLCPDNPESDELSSCSGQSDLTSNQLRGRFGGTRIFISALLEVPVHRRVNLFFLLEGVPFQGNRYAFTDRFASVMPDNDPKVYFRLGGAFKF